MTLDTLANPSGRDVVLAVNAGSSSLKFGLYEATGPARWTGRFEGLEPGGSPRAVVGHRRERALPSVPGLSGHQVAVNVLLNDLREHGIRLAAVAHRIVHGGDRFVAPCVLDDAILAQLQSLASLAPLHQPHNVAGASAFARAFPGVPQVGCFDTAFHAALPLVEQRLPLPPAFAERGLRRYGFHGLSYDYLCRTLREHTRRASGRALLAHLGNGASVCATRAGRSVATSMGFSALDGLMMGTRSGAIDPGVLLHLWREGWDLLRVERLLYKESGLLGVSGISADMRALRASDDARARLAIEQFTHRVRREAGAMLAVLGGVDLIAFTGGIGEHDALLRADVAASLGFAGVRIDALANMAAVGRRVAAIHAPDCAVEVWVVPTDEGRTAARAAFALLECQPA